MGRSEREREGGGERRDDGRKKMAVYVSACVNNKWKQAFTSNRLYLRFQHRTYAGVLFEFLGNAVTYANSNSMKNRQGTHNV